jgi:hypothetical protein
MTARPIGNRMLTHGGFDLWSPITASRQPSGRGLPGSSHSLVGGPKTNE